MCTKGVSAVATITLEQKTSPPFPTTHTHTTYTTIALYYINYKPTAE